MSTTLPTKDPVETPVINFLFGSEMLPGETIASATVVSTVIAGADPAPAAVLSGTFDLNTPSEVHQGVHGGVDGTTYKLRCVGTLNTGRILVRTAIMPVAVL